jgi:hypothetical protein
VRLTVRQPITRLAKARGRRDLEASHAGTKKRSAIRPRHPAQCQHDIPCAKTAVDNQTERSMWSDRTEAQPDEAGIEIILCPLVRGARRSFRPADLVHTHTARRRRRIATACRSHAPCRVADGHGQSTPRFYPIYLTSAGHDPSALPSCRLRCKSIFALRRIGVANNKCGLETACWRNDLRFD